MEHYPGLTGMGKFEFLVNEVRHLSREDLAAFRDWFLRFESEALDRRIEEGSQGMQTE